MDEVGEAGDGQRWRLGPIDLDNGVVEVHRPDPTGEATSSGDPDD